MPGFFLALLATLLASIGGRDQTAVSQLSRSFDKPLPLLAPAWLASLASAALAGIAGAWLAPMMPPGGKGVLMAIALAMAALELVWRSRGRVRPAPAEPTRSTVAIFIVLVAHQLGDAARFLIFALAVASAAAPLVIAGGALGAGVSLTLAWWLGQDIRSLRGGRLAQMLIAAALLVAASLIAIRALNLS